jgi:hypothetical protein
LWTISRPDGFIPWNEPAYPLNQSLDGPQSRNGLFWRKKSLSPEKEKLVKRQWVKEWIKMSKEKTK